IRLGANAPIHLLPQGEKGRPRMTRATSPQSPTPNPAPAARHDQTATPHFPARLQNDRALLERRGAGGIVRDLMFADIIRPISLSFSLLRRFWPQLVALVLAGVLAGDLLMQLAARVAL